MSNPPPPYPNGYVCPPVVVPAIPAPTDSWGAVPIPLVPTVGADKPAGGGNADPIAVQDPFLTETLRFLRAYLQTDGGAAKAFDALGVAPGQRVVATTHPYNPADRDHLFNDTSDLPAIFMWRDGEATDEYMADDWEVQTTPVKLMWCWPLAKAEIQSRRAPFIDALARAIKVGIQLGRTPSYQVAGDPDVQAAKLGSVFYGPAGIMMLFPKSHRAASFQIEMVAQANQRPPAPRTYRGLEMTFSLQENHAYGLGRFDAVTGGTQETLAINGGPQTVVGISKLPSFT